METHPKNDVEMPDTVSDHPSAIRFVRWCVETIGLGYHPDTRFSDYIDPYGKSCFALEEAHKLDLLQDAAFEYCDPYDVGFAEMQRIAPGLGIEFEDRTLKGPIIYHDPEFQRELIKTGTRQQIIDWLCWNDPNGTYSDRDCEIEGMIVPTIDQAREIMRNQIDPIQSVIPRISDNAANLANIVAIDRLVKTQKFHHIVAWGKWLGFTPPAVLHTVREAEADDAPADAIQKIDGRWLRLEDIQNESNRQRVADLTVKK